MGTGGRLLGELRGPLERHAQERPRIPECEVERLRGEEADGLAARICSLDRGLLGEAALVRCAL